MVRLNKQSDFQIPFIVSDSSIPIQLLKPNHIDLADRILSIFASIFFFAILLSITLDNSDLAKLTKTNSIVSHGQMKTTLPLTSLEVKENQKNKKTRTSENKILGLISSEKEIKIKTTQKVITPFSNPIKQKSNIIPGAKEIKISFPNESYLKKAIHLNQPKIHNVNNNDIVNTSTKTIMVSPKPVFVYNKIDDQQLIINDKITQDLLPLSYIRAKEKAANQDKLMYIKFGAKWCLPCSQMEKTTFKDEKVQAISEKNYISYSVDVDDFDGVNMKAYFNVKYLPTLLIFNSQGKFIAKYVNFLSASSMVKVLERHRFEEEIKSTITLKEEVRSLKIEDAKIEKIRSIEFNEIILSKKKNGVAITSLKSKGKNWRYTKLNFTAKNIHKGELLLKIKETSTGINLTNLNIPMMKNQGISDTPTTSFQLVLEHKKRKNKNGEYVVEIYHITQDDSKLVGNATLLKDGEIHF